MRWRPGLPSWLSPWLGDDDVLLGKREIRSTEICREEFGITIRLALREGPYDLKRLLRARQGAGEKNRAAGGLRLILLSLEFDVSAKCSAPRGDARPPLTSPAARG